MQRFIHRLNIEHYEKLLQTVTAEAHSQAARGREKKFDLDSSPERKRRRA